MTLDVHGIDVMRQYGGRAETLGLASGEWLLLRSVPSGPQSVTSLELGLRAADGPIIGGSCRCPSAASNYSFGLTQQGPAVIAAWIASDRTGGAERDAAHTRLRLARFAF